MMTPLAFLRPRLKPTIAGTLRLLSCLFLLVTMILIGFLYSGCKNNTPVLNSIYLFECIYESAYENDPDLRQLSGMIMPENGHWLSLRAGYRYMCLETNFIQACGPRSTYVHLEQVTLNASTQGNDIFESINVEPLRRLLPLQMTDLLIEGANNIMLLNGVLILNGCAIISIIAPILFSSNRDLRYTVGISGLYLLVISVFIILVAMFRTTGAIEMVAWVTATVAPETLRTLRGAKANEIMIVMLIMNASALAIMYGLHRRDQKRFYEASE